jgi:hypothetical protein
MKYWLFDVAGLSKWFPKFSINRKEQKFLPICLRLLTLLTIIKDPSLRVLGGNQDRQKFLSVHHKSYVWGRHVVSFCPPITKVMSGADILFHSVRPSQKLWEWNNMSAPDIYNIRTLSVNIKFICTSFRNRQNSEPLASFSGPFCSE